MRLSRSTLLTGATLVLLVAAIPAALREAWETGRIPGASGAPSRRRGPMTG